MVIVSMAGIFIGASGDYRTDNDTYQATVVTDDAGDSTVVLETEFGVMPLYGFNSLRARVIMENAKPTYAGLGLSDSAIVWMYTSFYTGERIVIDSVISPSLPCTLDIIIHSNVGDTLLRNYLSIGYQIHDTLGDTALTVEYPIKYEILLK